jgi:16S rRNA (guanine966-N2)-methyltransferase
LRVIAGKLKGRKLTAVKGQRARPTADRVREALFNILSRKPVDAMILDLFAGTGALGIEALSRGGRQTVFVDNAPQALTILRKNLEHCGMQQAAQVIKWDIAKNLNCLKGYPHTFNLVFMDPPYRKAMIRPTLLHLTQSGCLAADAIIIVEHDPCESVDTTATAMRLADQRRYGRTLLSFLEQHNPDD